MKTFISITILVALIAVGSFAHAGGIAFSRTFDLKFTGFCDGMRLTVDYTNGTVTGNRTGCGGATRQLVRGYLTSVVGGSYDGLAMVVGFDNGQGILYVIGDSPQNWQNRNLVTGAIINSGTWVLGVAVDAPASGVSSSAD